MFVFLINKSNVTWQNIEMLSKVVFNQNCNWPEVIEYDFLSLTGMVIRNSLPFHVPMVPNYFVNGP